MSELNPRSDRFLGVKASFEAIFAKEEAQSDCESLTFDTDVVAEKCLEDKIMDWLKGKGVRMEDPEDIVEEFQAKQKETLCRSTNFELGHSLRLQHSICITKSNLLLRRKNSHGKKNGIE